jgi:hypothetical protein
LRHAPDAQVEPPAALSALILNEARAKARDAAAPARAPRHPFLALWDWLARPSIATGFAGVMVATLVGLMWWDQPMDEAMPRQPARATAPSAPPSLAEAPVVAAPAAPRAEAPRRAAQAPRPASRKTAPEADKRANQAAAPAAATAPARARDELSTDGATEAEHREAATPTPAPITTPAAPPSPAPAPAAMADTAPATTAPVAGALAKAKSAEELKRQRSANFAADIRGRTAKAEANDSAARQAAAARVSLASVRAAIAAEPARWAWQRGSGPVHDMNDTVYAWLAQLDGAAGTAWQSTASENTSASPSGELKLLRDGQLVHTLRLADQGVLWKNGQSTWRTELPAATLQALESTAP